MYVNLAVTYSATAMVKGTGNKIKTTAKVNFYCYVLIINISRQYYYKQLRKKNYKNTNESTSTIEILDFRNSFIEEDNLKAICCFELMHVALIISIGN